MKKKILTLLALSVLLTACGTKEADKKVTASSSPKTEKSTKDSSTEETKESTPPSSVEEVEKTAAYQYEMNQDGETQVIKETLVYKGDTFRKMELHITHKATEETKANFAGLDFETVKGELVSYLSQQASVQQLKAVPGVTFGMDVTPEYDVIMDIHIDMATVDLKALSEVEGMGADFTQLSNVTPTEYILGLKLNGATEVTQ